MRNLLYGIIGVLAGMLLAVSLSFAQVATFEAQDLPVGAPVQVTYKLQKTGCGQGSGMIGQFMTREKMLVSWYQGCDVETKILTYAGMDGKAFMSFNDLGPVSDLRFTDTVVSLGLDEKMQFVGALAGIAGAFLLWGAVLYNQ